MAAAPFLLFPTPKRSLDMLIIPGTWGLHWIVNRQPSRRKDGQPAQDRVTPIPITPLNFPILLLAFMVLVSTWATYYISLSLPKISGLVLGLGVYFALVREEKQPSGFWFGLLSFLVAGLGVSAISLVGTRWPSKIGIFDSIQSRLPIFIKGLQGAETGFHSNEIAGALIWVLPGFLALSIYLYPGFLLDCLIFTRSVDRPCCDPDCKFCPGIRALRRSHSPSPRLDDRQRDNNEWCIISRHS